MENKIKEVKKRDGTTASFKQNKVTEAILAAGRETGEFNSEVAKELSEKVTNTLTKISNRRKMPVGIEEIQDIVEATLMKEDYIKAAKAYILYRKEHQRIREERRKVLNGRSTTLPLDLNSLKILAGRYLRKDPETGEVLEIPEEMFQRVSKTLARVERRYGKAEKEIRRIEREFYKTIVDFEFLPAGRTLTNAGASTPVVSNCIVLHIKDSMDGIFNTLHDAALLQQAGSGIGFPFHNLRPANSLAERTQGKASGPVSFLQVYDKAFGTIKQQSRHGANMAVMRVDHPDVLDFVHSKDREGELSNFNISVSLTDDFMRKVDNESENSWMCEFKGKKIFPRKITRDKYSHITDVQEVKITPSEIMEEISSNAWSNGEPGVIFIDQINKTNPLPGLGRIEASNPCGEQFLQDGDVCNLGSINLDNFVDENKNIKWERLKEVTQTATRMLDNVVDITEFPIDHVNKKFVKNRRIGIGIMGFADFLLQMDIPYDSEEGLETAEKVMKFINESAHQASQELAEEKGVFENYNKSIWKQRGVKMRNAALTCIAPTGTISMIPEVSSGVEPYFALAYTKQQVMGQEKFHYMNKYLEEKLKERDLYTPKIVNKIYNKGTIQSIKEIPEDIKRVFVGAMDISPKDHIRMQAAFQKHLDNSISKTVNLPNEATKADVKEAIKFAWKKKCKAFTVYRSGSREEEVLTVKSKRTKSKTFSKPEKERSNVDNGCSNCGF